jgi:hypothetical protein
VLGLWPGENSQMCFISWVLALCCSSSFHLSHSVPVHAYMYGGALALCGALGLWLALEGAVPSRGRRWHRSGLSDGGGNGNGGALALCGAPGLWLALEGAVPSR